MATTTPNFGWPVPTSTDLVKDGATAIEALGDGVDASFIDLKGGTTGQVLAKASNTDLDYSWVTTDDTNAIQNAIVDAKGDLIGATAADTPARLAVGTNGQVLTADSTAATGLAWASAAAASPLTTKGDVYTYSTANARLAVGGDYGFLQADSTAATGLAWNASAWTTYTPTITAGSGTFTTVSATGRYIRIGKLCVVQQTITVTTNGTAATEVRATIPFTGTANQQMGAGREYNVTGNMLQGEVGTTYIGWRTYNNNYPLGTNYAMFGTATFEVA